VAQTKKKALELHKAGDADSARKALTHAKALQAQLDGLTGGTAPTHAHAPDPASTHAHTSAPAPAAKPAPTPVVAKPVPQIARPAPVSPINYVFLFYERRTEGARYSCIYYFYFYNCLH
jgi:hypothetical protein